MKKSTKYLVGITILIAITIWLAVFSTRNSNLKIIACDVGQGDAILIVNGSVQILIDGGTDEKVIKCLDKYIYFWDRKIELVVLTHPQVDHYGGLTEIFEKYEVYFMLQNGQNASSPEYQLLKSLVGGSNTKILYAADARSIGIDLMQLEILHPSKNFNLANSNDRDPNEFSIVTLLHFADFDAIVTGDIPLSISDILSHAPSLRSNKIEYLKVPHHGSKNGLSKKLLDSVNPSIAVISVGSKNRYGHPHKEILDMLKEKGVRTLRTDQSSDVVVESDGKNWWVN